MRHAVARRERDGQRGTIVDRPPSSITPGASPSRRSGANGVLLACALAYAGAVIGYLPLLTLLLPIKVDQVAGVDRLTVLTATVIAGAIAASIANIGFGWLSDRAVAQGRGRRRGLAYGVVATIAAYAVLPLATTPALLLGTIILFQIALNAVIAPLMAIIAEEVPDERKGVAGGLLALANPVAAMLSAALVGVSLFDGRARLAIIAVAVALFTVPLLVTRSPPAVRAEPVAAIRAGLRRDLVIAWSARLLVQVAGSALFVYLLYYLRSVAPSVSAAAIAARMGGVMIVADSVPLPIAVLIGRLADRTGRTKPFLAAAAMVAAAGLVGMMLATNFAGGAAAFCVYTGGTSVFLALHASFAMQLLPSARHRGRDLGILNLTNTLPGLLGPVLTWMLATPRDFDAVLIVLIVLTLGGGLLILGARGRR